MSSIEAFKSLVTVKDSILQVAESVPTTIEQLKTSFFKSKVPEVPESIPHELSRKRINDFKQVFASKELRTQFDDFLKNIFLQLDGPKFFDLMDNILSKNLSYEETYEELFNRIGEAKNGRVKTFFAQIRSLKVIKETLAGQMEKLLGRGTKVKGYAEIGYPGRLIRPLKSQADIRIEGPKYVITEKEKFTDYIEAGFPLPYDKFIPIDDYAPISAQIGDSSLELITCPIGLHHIPEDKIQQFVQSIQDSLKVGGTFILRDHDAKTKKLDALVNVVHSVFNAATGVPLKEEITEIRNFRPLNDWIKLLESNGFHYEGEALKTPGDPTHNALMKFTRLPRDKEEAQLATANSAVKMYERPQEQTYLTTIEWHLVALAKEYADFIKEKPIHQFPFFKHVKVLWQTFFSSCKEGIQASNLSRVATSEYMLMNLFMLVSTTLELSFKGAIFAPMALFKKPREEGDFDVREIVAKDADDYAEFIKSVPFYEFPYFKKTWALVKAFTKASKKSFTSSYITTLTIMEYLAKGITSTPLAKAYSGVETGKIHLVVKDHSNEVGTNLDNRIKVLTPDSPFKALEAPRYLQFKNILQKLARTNAQIISIAGQKKIQMKVKTKNSPITTENCQFFKILGEIPIITNPDYKYTRLEVDVGILSNVIRSLEDVGAEITYIHDF